MRIKEILHNRATRIGVFLMTVTGLLGLVPAARAAAGNNNLKIVAWYGAGSLSTSEYAYDTIILFNPTQQPITMDNWSLQLGSTGGTFTAVSYKLPVATIPPGGFYALQGSGPGAGTGCKGANCESGFTYDYQLGTIEGKWTDSINILSSTAYVVALVDNQTPLGTGCPLSSPDLVDILGVGAADGSSEPTCHAGDSNAPYTPASLNGKTTSIHGVKYAYATVRKNRCVDTFNNGGDYMLGYIDFENANSTPKPCPAGNQLTVNAVASPDNPAVGGSFTISATVSPATGGTIQSVTADLSNLGLSAATQLYDDGSHGDAVSGDGVYSLTTSPASGSNGLVLGLNVNVTDNEGNAAGDSIPFSLGGGNVPGPGNNNLEIVAWYGAGNLSNSEYARDTVILFNPTQQPITMNNWSLQTGGATGSFSTMYQLPVVTIPAGGYYALTGSGPAYISGNGCITGHCNLNYAYDYQLNTLEGSAATNQNSLSSTAVVVALVSNQTKLGSGCPINSPNVVDLVGIGASNGSSPVSCYAGGNYAFYTPSISGHTINGIVYAYATVRKNKCINTFDNASDFMLGYIDFENSATPPRPCPTGNQLSVSTVDVTPSSVGIADPFTIDATVFPATSPDSGAISVTADLSNLGLSATTALYDDGTHGDSRAGDHIYSLATASKAGILGPEPGLIVTATDARGQVAQNLVPLTILSGQIKLTTPTTTATVDSGGVATFPLTVTSVHGYSGILVIQCTGSPNTNALGVPYNTQCVATPPQVTMTANGTATISLKVAMATTAEAGVLSRPWPLAILGLLSFGVLGLGMRRRKSLGKSLPMALLVALAIVMTLNTTACGKNGGLLGTSATSGAYTYVVTATDSNTPSVTSALTLNVNVQ